MKTVKSAIIFAAVVAGTSSVYAASHVGAPTAKSGPNVEAGNSAASGLTEGEVRKVDMDTKKITLKHGDIKNLDMPGMTMVFQVKDPAMLEKVKAGDKVRFKAEKANGAIVVTDLQLVK